MAITATDKQTKLKLVHTSLNDEGKTVKKSATYSNIKDEVSNEVLMTGAKAMNKLFAEMPAEIRRVDEVVLTEE